MEACLTAVDLVSYLGRQWPEAPPQLPPSPLPPVYFTGASMLAVELSRTRQWLTFQMRNVRKEQSSVADFILKSVQRSMRRNVNIPEGSASASVPTTLPPEAAQPASLAWEIIRKSLSILRWTLTLTSVDSKNFYTLCEWVQKALSEFSKSFFWGW